MPGECIAACSASSACDAFQPTSSYWSPPLQTLRDLFNRQLELGILQRIPAYSTAPGAVPLPLGTPAAGAVGEAVAGAVEATVEAVAPGGKGMGRKKAA